MNPIVNCLATNGKYSLVSVTMPEIKYYELQGKETMMFTDVDIAIKAFLRRVL